MRKAALVIACLALVAGCGGDDPPSAAPSAAATAKALAGSPPALAALHKQANELLGGGKPAFEARLQELRGHPVVVNKWGSWCAPCRGEFPAFQKASIRLGKEVAFLGLDGEDPVDSAKRFLERFPVSYPSYKDTDGSIAATIQAGVAYPTTVFFDPAGKLVYSHPGPYRNAADLIADIRRYTK